MSTVDGIQRLRDRGGVGQITLRDLADDLADYIAMRPETAKTLDGLASFLAGLHSATPDPEHGRAHVLRQLLPGEAEDIQSNASADRWVNVYQQLIDAAEVTGLGVDIQVHLLSRLAFWQLRQSDTELAGKRAMQPIRP